MDANQLQTASDYDLRYRYLRMQGHRQSLRPSRQPLYHASQFQSHSADATKGCRLRASPATTSRVVIATRAHTAGTKRIEEAFEGKKQLIVTFGM